MADSPDHQPLPGPVSSAGDEHLIERTVRSEQVYRGHFLQVWRDVAALPDGREVGREFIRHPGAVMVIPFLDDGRVVMERQYRYPLARVMLEFPAGKLEPGEPTWNTACRELREETGYEAREWALAGRLHNAIAYSDEFIEVWLARGLRSVGQHLDEGELLDVLAVSEADLPGLALRGDITDAKTLIGMLWLNWRASGLWQPQWSTAPLEAPDGAGRSQPPIMAP